MIKRLLKLFPQYQDLESRIAELAAEKALNAILDRKLTEVTTERDQWQRRACDWEERYVAQSKELAEALKSAADAMWIRATGMTMFGAIQPPAPVAQQYEHAPQGPRLARDIIAERTRENAEKAMARIGLIGGIPSDPAVKSPQTAEELTEFFRQEQEKFKAG